MINKNKKSFSLAELLISMLITTIILSAIIPVVVKKTVSESVVERIWQWDDSGNSIYAITGSKQKACVGGICNNDSTTPAKINIILNKYETLKHHIGFFNNDTKAGYMKIDKDYNIILGRNAFNNNSSSKYNIAIGYNTLSKIMPTSATNNIAIGNEALEGLASGSYNIALGDYALGLTSEYDKNHFPTGSIAIGESALKLLYGNYNVGIGYSTGIGRATNASTGGYNVLIGPSVAKEITSGYNNVAIGYNALMNHTSGYKNVLIGYGAGYKPDSTKELDTGYFQNIGIGYKNLLPHDGLPKQSFAIGNGDNTFLYFVPNRDNPQKNKIIFNGYFKTKSIANNLYIWMPELGIKKKIEFDHYGSINIPCNSFCGRNYSVHANEIKALNIHGPEENSDIRLKSIIGNSLDGINKINKIQVKKYTYKDDTEKKVHTGVIAQDVQKIFPNSVNKDSDGFLHISTDEIFYAMLNTTKELFNRVLMIEKNIIEKLKQENSRLTKENNELIEQIKTQDLLIKEKYSKIDNRLTKIENKILVKSK